MNGWWRWPADRLLWSGHYPIWVANETSSPSPAAAGKRRPRALRPRSLSAGPVKESNATQPRSARGWPPSQSCPPADDQQAPHCTHRRASHPGQHHPRHSPDGRRRSPDRSTATRRRAHWVCTAAAHRRPGVERSAAAATAIPASPDQRWTLAKQHHAHAERPRLRPGNRVRRAYCPHQRPPHR